MLAALRFAVLASVKLLARVFYGFRYEPVDGGAMPARWDDVRVGALINHTSLFEPLFLGGMPWRFLWAVASHGLMPGADTTLERPIVGRFYKALAPEVVPLTRVRDQTWRDFLGRLHPRSLVLMTPEGRMMRRGGLDKRGMPMRIRSGIAEVLEGLDDGRLFLFYSGGLHHVHAPGDAFPRLFRRLRARFEVLDIAGYKRDLGAGTDGFRERVTQDLERRRDRWCPAS